jgi:hypothetical protein
MSKVQEHRLMTEAEHLALVAKIVACHPWTEHHVFKPAPDYLEAAENLLSEIEKKRNNTWHT